MRDLGRLLLNPFVFLFVVFLVAVAAGAPGGATLFVLLLAAAFVWAVVIAVVYFRGAR